MYTKHNHVFFRIYLFRGRIARYCRLYTSCMEAMYGGTGTIQTLNDKLHT
jgi:hypothetical protein